MSALSILAEECELLNDSKYRSYITQVEKALKSFDSTSEWADLISALGKLNKVLLAHVRYPVIPKRVTIGKRLAQCLHPALPSGVHMKALETYDIIFKCIGTDRLAQDLFIYSAGLFPLLSYSAMNVKPVLLMIYERHFVTLGRRIKPGLNGLLLGLLPGLEEGSDFYDQTDALLLDFSECTDPPYFYTCLWECVHSCPSVRLAAITFLMSHYNKKQTMEDQLHMVGLNISLMIEAMCSAVQDSSVLVQRSMLDFLLVAFPMHNRQLTHADMARVVVAAINVLLRRDMSLNRRFYAWLLGSNTMMVQVQEVRSKGDISESSSGEMTYFERYSQDLLVQALRQLLVEKPNGSDTVSARSAVLKPFRILISLLDKPEIGPVILESVLLSIFRCLCREYDISKSSKVSKVGKQSAKKDNSYYEELLKTANLLFGTFEPYFIWDYASRKFQEACARSQRPARKVSSQQSVSETQESADVDELCTLVAYLLDIVSLETFSETQTEHLPNLLCSLISSLTHHCHHLPDTHILRLLRLCTKILSKVQPTMTVSGSHDQSADTSCDASLLEAVEMGSSTVSSRPVPDPMSVEEALNINQKLKVEEPITQSDASLRSDTTQPADSLRSDATQHESTKNSSKSGETDSKESEDAKNDDSDANKKTAVTRTFSKHCKSVNLMQQCIDCFQEFFHTFVNVKLFQEKYLVQSYFARVIDDAHFSKVQPSSDGPIVLDGCDQDRVQAFSTACQLLVEFASFPMYSQAKPPNTESTCMPAWVQDLIVCACYVDNFPIQSAAISVLLDLIILNQSVQRPASTTDVSREEVVSVQILPTLHFRHLNFLVEKTHFFQTSAEVLWGYLGDGTPDCHQTAVKLLYILHQVAPSTWVCEDVIGNQLAHHDEAVQLAAFRRFTTLWHLTRSRNTDVIPGKPHRNFHRSMFVLLDCLSEETSAFRVLATTWLTHVIQQGDISRVMEPVLHMLLHPDTARVSVQHINIHEPRRVTLSESSEDNCEANIYAISNEGGNVIYHVNSPKLYTKNKPGTRASIRSHAMTVLGERGTLTESSRSKSEQELYFEKVDPSNLSLRINPFGSESSIDTVGFDNMPPLQPLNAGMLRAKRLDKETCAKEGIHFTGNDDETSNDVSDGETEESEDRPAAPQDIVRGIIDDILLNVIKPEPVPALSLSERADSTTSSNVGDQDLLNRVQKQRVDSPTPSEKDMPLFQELDRDTTNVHSLHMHMLLYTQKYDFERTLYALSTIKAMLTACPRLMVTALVTTNISTLKAPQLAKLQLLLARHRKSVFGKNFYGDIPADVMSTYRSSMFIEVLISVCLYFVRGYYPNLMMSKLTCDELLGNKQVHILATETLTLLLSQVVNIMKDSGKNFASYISDLFQRCKVQKALLHCVLAVIYNSRQKQDTEQTVVKFTDEIVQFNEENLIPAVNETFLVKLLDLLSVMISLEEQIYSYLGLGHIIPVDSEWDRLKISYQPTLNNVKYTVGQPIVQQGMFVSGVLSALKQTHLCHLHRHWFTLITTSLPHLGKHLPGIVLTVVAQLCRNIEALAAYYETEGQGSPALSSIPPDHLLTMMENLMTLCHYCLLDNVSPVSIGQQVPSSANNNAANSGSNTNILTNLFHVFNPVTRDTSPQRDAGVISPVLEARNNILSMMPRIMACLTALWRAVNIVDKRDDASTVVLGAPKVVRQYILEFISPISLPHGIHLLGAIAVAWNDRRRKPAPKAIRKVVEDPSEDQLLLVELVGALRVLPLDTLIHTVKEVLANPPNSELSRKRSISLEVNMLQFFYAYVQRSSPGQLSDSWSALSTLLRDSLQINLNAPGQFLLLMILNEFVQKTPAFTEKRYQREIQELSQRLLEAVSNIAGSSLEQSTWLRKNYAVKPGPQQSADTEVEETSQPETEPVAMHKRVADLDPVKLNSAESKYSVQALSVLAEITAPLLDVTYSSEEKDRVAPFLITLLYNIFPYLRAHGSYNLPSLRVASQFVASISSYQYMRKAWRREVLELLLDPGFFQMDLESIRFWTTVVDNLMTHDKTTYKDLMARVSMAQTGSLNLFTSREQEIDQKAGMLKRLAFTIFCSESDQYQKSIPEIQEKLAESLRLPSAPSVMAQVFLCFRVLMLRVSPQHLTSMWPTIITELIHVFLQIEQELSTETEEFVVQVQRIAALDSSWAHLGNELNAHNNPAWLQLYLSACKLLDLCLALPADRVPQFQLYRWAFIGGAAAGEGDDGPDMEPADRPAGGAQKTAAGKVRAKRKEARFNPHIIRLARLLNTKLKGDVPLTKVTPGRPLITVTYLRSLQELQPFFNTLCLANQSDNLMLAARQLGANLSLKQSAAMTNGHGGQNLGHVSPSPSDSSGRSSAMRGMPKSKSAPSFAVPQPVSEHGPGVTSNKQFIEDVLLRDFLELVP